MPISDCQLLCLAQTTSQTIFGIAISVPSFTDVSAGTWNVTTLELLCPVC